MPEPSPLDVVRSRFPRTPDADADALLAHAEHLARLRDSLTRGQSAGRGARRHFRPRGTGSHAERPTSR